MPGEKLTPEQRRELCAYLRRDLEESLYDLYHAYKEFYAPSSPEPEFKELLARIRERAEGIIDLIKKVCP